MNPVNYGYSNAYAHSNVALTSIPYTGYDFGIGGDMLYWLAISAFALLGAYLIVYYKGGVISFFSQLKQQFMAR